MILNVLDLQRLRTALDSRTGAGVGPVGARVEYHIKISSTNDRARELALSGEPEGTVVASAEQTHGRGRASNSWHSPAHLGLYLSTILRPVASPMEVPVFGLLCAVATVSSLHRLGAHRIRIKWPNDLIVPPGRPSSRYRKVGGILTEARTTEETIRDLVMGVGINVNHQESDFPAQLLGRPISLRLLMGHGLDMTSVAFQVLAGLDEWYMTWVREGNGAIVSRYRELAVGLQGNRVRVQAGSMAWTGMTAGLAPDGALRVVPDDPARAVIDGVVEVRYGELSHIEER